MTEPEWLQSADPAAMLRSLKDRITHRRARLFAVACLRRIAHHFADDRLPRAVDLIEFLADDPTNPPLTVAHNLVQEAREVLFNLAYRSGHDVFHPTVYAGDAVHKITFFSAPWVAAVATAGECGRAVGAVAGDDEAEGDRLQSAEKAEQACLVREVFGNPFRPVTLHRHWCTPDVTGLARALYDARQFADTPILADALEDAGCNDADVLGHCRRVAGVHVRGCWVVDLILGRS